MKRRTLALLVALSLVAVMLPAAVFAAEGTVTCTVSATLVSITVEDGNVDYGALDLGETKNTALYDETHNAYGMTTPQTQNITNTGNVNVDLWISSSDAIGATNWTLSTTTVSANEFALGWYDSATPYVGGEAIGFTSFGGTAGVSFGMANSGGNVTPGDSRYLELEIDMPSETTDYGEHAITVTVEAVQS
jgi:hypothetical protein